MNAQFHTLQQEIVQMNSTLSEIKNQQFQQQIQEIKEDIDHVTTRVTEVEASIQFNDSERAAIKDNIKRIEQRQKEDMIRVQQMNNNQSAKVVTCDCSKRLDQLELTARKKNIIIAGVTERRDERLKHITLEILSNTNLPINLNDIEQAVRIGTFRQKGPPRPILVKFWDISVRDQIMANRYLIKSNPNCSKIWINEDLPEKNKKIRYKMKILGDLAVNLDHQVILKGEKSEIDGTTYSENTLDQLPQHLSLERAFTRDTPNGIAFHSEHSYLSSFYPTDINFNQNKYTTAEQGIQHSKAKVHKHEDIAQEIMKTHDPIKVKRLGDKIKPNEAWLKHQDKWAEEITFAKFDQNPKLAQALVKTKQAPLLECTLSSHWGVGVHITNPELYKKSFKPKGKNTLGKILEKKRADLRPSINATQPPPPPPPPPLLTHTVKPGNNSPAVTPAPPPIPPRTSPTPLPAHTDQSIGKKPAETDQPPLLPLNLSHINNNWLCTKRMHRGIPHHKISKITELLS